MSGGADDDSGAGGRARPFKRERVTLKWNRPPLRLPGEPAPEEFEEPLSVELELPDYAAADAARPSAAPPPELETETDAWVRDHPTTRSRARSEGAPSRPPSSPPLDGGALSLVDERGRPPSSPAVDPVAEMRDRFELGDFTAALRTAELVLGRNPDHLEAQQISAASRERLVQLYGSRLGALSRAPVLAVDGAEVRWLGLDHRAGFLLSRVDGTHTIEDLLDLSGMSRLEALKILVELVDMGAIRLSD